MIDAIITHHRDRYRSGVAGFNEVLAARLGVPLLGLTELTSGLRRPLLSFKVRELDPEGLAVVEDFADTKPFEWEIFLHDYAGLPLEQRLIAEAAVVYSGNREIDARVESLNPNRDTLWAPGLLLDQREFQPAEISVFAFGMAHKLRSEMFQKLAALLEQTGRPYAVYASAANHETASLRDTEVVFQELSALFPKSLFFLGNLSDVAVWHYLAECTFYTAFFPGGVRANNSSVSAAFDRGAVVVTNLDEHSPPEYVHMDNLIDIEQCTELPLDPAVLKRIGERARETASSRGWDSLVERLR